MWGIHQSKRIHSAQCLRLQESSTLAHQIPLTIIIVLLIMAEGMILMLLPDALCSLELLFLQSH
jgi:hypothetical protein